MALTPTTFTPADVRALIRGPTEDERAAVAYKLCRKIDRDLSESDRAAADEILRVMVADVATSVRKALAVTLRTSKVVPRDVAVRLSEDVEEIATPFLNFSPVFTDADLIEILQRAEPFRQIAIAKRETLSERVVDVIAHKACADAVATAAANEGAQFTEKAMVVSLERFKQSRAIPQALAYRSALPTAIVERLVARVSEEVRHHLISRHNLSPILAAKLASATRERATVDLVDQIALTADVDAFAKHLAENDRLTPSLLLRAVACGYVTFFESAMAYLAVLPRHRAWLLIHDAGRLGFKALYERAGMPNRLYPVFCAALETIRELSSEGGVQDLESFQASLLERMLTQPQAIPREDVEYLIERLDQLSPERRDMSDVA